MTFAPSAAAFVTAAARSASEADLAPTYRMEHCGQTAATISRSSISSWPQPTLPVTVVMAAPVWLTWVNGAVPSPNFSRYAARSAAALGLAYASTTATSGAFAPNGPYASWSAAGVSPEV